MANYTWNTPIQKINDSLYVKRDDMIPFSFGGNKARKVFYFFDEIGAGGYDCVVTYGSHRSNHCRVVANMAAQRNIPCYIVSPTEISKETFNMKMVKLFGAEVIDTPLDSVSETIEETISNLKNKGANPYFIQGGGHGNIGTQAYIDCYKEIKDYETANNTFFDYIFLASGTGTTQAGLVCGQLMNNDNRSIIGISIARKNPYGKAVVLESIKDYLGEKYSEDELDKKVVFVDTFAGEYGASTREIDNTIDEVIAKYGIALDQTYTGKAFYGMLEIIKKESLSNKKILFINTGSVPLFFDNLVGE